MRVDYRREYKGHWLLAQRVRNGWIARVYYKDRFIATGIKQPTLLGAMCKAMKRASQHDRVIRAAG